MESQSNLRHRHPARFLAENGHRDAPSSAVGRLQRREGGQRSANGSPNASRFARNGRQVSLSCFISSGYGKNFATVSSLRVLIE